MSINAPRKRDRPIRWSEGAAGPALTLPAAIPGSRAGAEGTRGAALGALSSVPDLSWMDRGHCTRMDREAFFPPEKGIPSPEARAACDGCPIRRTCFTYAVERGNTWGYWGGVLFEYGRPVDVDARIRERADRPASVTSPRDRMPDAVPGVHKCDRHDRTESNTRKLPGGRVRCLDCERDRCRNYRLRQKEAA